MEVTEHEVLLSLMKFMSEMGFLCNCQDPEKLAREWPRELPLMTVSSDVCSKAFANARLDQCMLFYRNVKFGNFHAITIVEKQRARWVIHDTCSHRLRHIRFSTFCQLY
eukprot:Gregarina_sp_Poly_1__2842@NODE_1793_length_3321_cov_76_000000_g1167_i0_p6_GENE_NODE_1793_length_3321_cov_76_000000_g1167_i0NODE_1793_length_3321_cov_76_000000_g1167_i0_p6_ORF_typecomplete_len109_score10_87_NODE_1793_length_3321_cov_76_000000_g1167_i024412767